MTDVAKYLNVELAEKVSKKQLEIQTGQLKPVKKIKREIDPDEYRDNEEDR